MSPDHPTRRPTANGFDPASQPTSRLADRSWRTKYSPEDGNLLQEFYIPALKRTVRYDRSTGYFRASALAAAARGVEGLVRNGGRMRLIVGCTLNAPEAEAIQRGESLRGTVEANLSRIPLQSEDRRVIDALELLAWMVAKNFLDVKVAVPCDAHRRPVPGLAIFHEKAGILEDGAGDRIAFNGSINESETGWTGNFDSFHVFTSWGNAAVHVVAEEESFRRLWADRGQTVIVLDVPAAVRDKLLAFLPEGDALPRRLQGTGEDRKTWGTPETPPPDSAPTSQLREDIPGRAAETTDTNPELDPLLALDDVRKALWNFIHAAPTFPSGGERVGEATCPVTPWPHQVRAFHRMYDHWPPRLLIADEVGLGKTIQAGLILRQAWLAGRAKRILVLAPKAVLPQWQIELREKFNLNWPIYDGKKFSWYPSPARNGQTQRPAARDCWHEEPFVLASSHLMRRRDRAGELLESAKRYDLIVLDEAHHARRRGGGLAASDDRPNQLLRLMRRLRRKTEGLILLTATPMQVSPVEVWDLLDLLGLPPEWSANAFLQFFEHAATPIPGDAELHQMAALFRAVERHFGPVTLPEAMKHAPGGKKLKANKILRALRDEAAQPRRDLEADNRRAAVRLMKAHTPIKRLISRHTRELLRKYHQSGQIDARIAKRVVRESSVQMTEAERAVYQAVEDYISTTYHNADPDRRTAIGFVMTIYRRRLASSFFALARTLEERRRAVAAPDLPLSSEADRMGEDVMEDEWTGEVMDEEEAADLETEALALEEKSELDRLLSEIRQLPTDTKAAELLDQVERLRAEGFQQVMIFTQYTDTLDFLRKEIADRFGANSVLCFSGRGGEIAEAGGGWRRISREETKQRFRAKTAEILLCTDAAAEGLNFQFCGALINYDMPWNPMRVEQRIGRIDRLGQVHPRIRIVNLLYEDTVETDVYRALRQRIGLFTSFVGKLQPILARLPRAISEVSLGPAQEKERARAALVDDLTRQADQLEAEGFDLDKASDHELAVPDRPEPPYGLPELGRILTGDRLLPPGQEARKLGAKDIEWLGPGMPHPLRVTTDPEFFDAHPESTELWSPGSPIFPTNETPRTDDPVDRETFLRILEAKGNLER